MITCPIDKKSRVWKGLVKSVGENNAYGLWALYNGEVPQSAIDSVGSKQVETIAQRSIGIPAKKLQSILIKEVSSRQGYPDNMLSALELNKAGTDFKIPLWASPYASKFESILTSKISKNVVNQKFSGHSYVLGSPEGFMQGAEANEEIKNTSGIVFSNNFDHKKGLQPMRHDPKTGKILPAQIMIPFKFRDENGNILNIQDFTTKDENGKTILDTDKIPEKVLQLFGFRIPTQERNSMSGVEVVGFLPEESGDLLLAPRDWTAQMGSDFDVDKLYTYMYNTYYKDGKLHTDFISDKKVIESKLDAINEEIELLKAEATLSEEQEVLLEKYENREDLTEGEESGLRKILNSLNTSKEASSKLEAAYNERSMLKRSYTASQQNAILDIHMKVMLSNNPEVIASILALDSFGEFKSMSTEINKARTDKGQISKHSTILSDSYQRDKYVNATAGQNGVGSFSLDSTFNATAQGKDLVIVNSEEANELIKKGEATAEEILALNGPVITFGNLVSQGDISNKYTLRSQKALAERSLTAKDKASLISKSAIIRYLQSSAVDNANEEILDKLNINDETFDAIRALTILGFEETEIVGMITQDIIWEFIEDVRNAKAGLFGFVANVEDTILEKLKEKYDPQQKLDKLDGKVKDELGNVSGEEMIDIAKNKVLEAPAEGTVTSDANIQQILFLEKFLKLTDIGKSIKVLQSSINSDKKVPTTLIETDVKVKQINKLGKSGIFNSGALLGNYEQGTLVEPTTINGFASFYGTMFANNIYNKYFPYKEKGISDINTEVALHLPSGDDMSITKQAEVRTNVFKAVRSFLFSNEETGLFTEDANNERSRLFLDTDTNQSLATILNSVKDQAWFQQNGFLSKLDFKLNSNGELSRTFFENATGENFDESNIYLGFNYLMEKNFSIGKFNGIEYTSRMIGQELVMAAFLEGAVENSKQYLKYIPTSYLKSASFGEYLSGTPFDFSDTFGGKSFIKSPSYHIPSAFTKQYFRNNPQDARKVDLSDMEGTIKSSPESFTLKESSMKNYFIDVVNEENNETDKTLPHFLAIYDNKVEGNHVLYEFDSRPESREYKRVSTLNDKYGFSQYNSNGNKQVVSVRPQKIVDQVVNQTHPAFTHVPSQTKPTKKFEVGTANNKNPINTLGTLPIDSRLIGKEALDDMLNTLATEPGVSEYNKRLLQELRTLPIADTLTLAYTNEPNGPLGEYTGKDGTGKLIDTITLNLGANKHRNVNEIATTFIHEFVHAFTSRSIYAYNRGGDMVNLEIASAISNLKDLQKTYIDKLIEKEGREGFDTFRKNFAIYKHEKGRITKEQLDAQLKDIENSESLPENDTWRTEELKSKYYGAVNLQEFVTMALTDIAFQKHLNEITVDDEMPFFTKFLDAIKKLLNALGIDIKPNSLLAHAIDESLTLAKAQAKDVKAYEDMLKAEQPKNIVKPTIEGGESTVETVNRYSVADLKANPNKIFVFGDNLVRTGKGGQAIVRDEENAFGIATKMQPNRTNDAYFTDDLYESNVIIIDKDIQAIKDDGRNVVFPKDGLGTGLAKLKEKAPKTFEYLNKRLMEEFGFNNETGEVTKPTTTITKGKFEYKGKSVDTSFDLTEGQNEALKELVDFSKSDDKFITLQGAAGTGKTSVIGYLQKYLGQGTTFVYMTPTHAANAELAAATVKTGNRDLPITVASAVGETKNRKTGKWESVARKKLTDRLGYTDNIIVLDETSMLSNRGYDTLKKALEKHNVKVIFMGDISQIPEVTTATVEQKSVSKAFINEKQLNLTEVKRTESDSILKVLTAIRNNKNNKIPQIENTEELQYLQGTDFDNKIVETFTESPEESVLISYTNAGVQAANSKIRKSLGRSGSLQQGDIIVGYAGYNSKQIEDGNIANSVRYTVDNAVKEKDGSGYLIIAKSKKLKKLQDKNVRNVEELASGIYLQLAATDAIVFNDLTNSNYTDNNERVSLRMKKLYDAKQAALKNGKMWSDYYDTANKTSKYFQNILLGDDYIFNPSTNKMERFNYSIHGNIKKSFPELFVSKSVDYGHAVTIHKSQGSTVKNVFFDARTLPKGGSSKLMQGNKQVGTEKHALLYVGMSRASELLVVNNEHSEHFYPLETKPFSLSKEEAEKYAGKGPQPGDAFEGTAPEVPSDESIAIAKFEEFKKICK